MIGTFCATCTITGYPCSDNILPLNPEPMLISRNIFQLFMPLFQSKGKESCNNIEHQQWTARRLIG